MVEYCVVVVLVRAALLTTSWQRTAFFLVTAEDMLLRWPYKCYSSLSMIIADC